MRAPLTAPRHDVNNPSPKAAIAKEAKHYIAHRPPYPASMWELWTDYHQGPLASAHDIGAGSGNGAEGLLTHTTPQLERVVITEPRDVNVADCRARFRDRFPGTDFTFRTCRGEDPWDPPPSAGTGHVDLVMACESLHWTVLEPTLANVAASLRAGGTFAAVIYGPFPIITNSGVADAAFRDFIGEHAAGLLERGWMSEDWKRAARQMFHGMDCVPLADRVWEDVRRIEVNCRDGWYAKHYEPMEGTAEPVADLGTYERVAVDDSPDWQISASVEWLKQSLESMRFGFTEASWASPKWLTIQEAVQDGPLELQWQVQMILARKRG
ncbi:Methyltransferase [Colletotrichum orbiculare MAFF 240422]|uniref:Methyltransferase n=1 Tax=Colletotrichum orbiculare (strain 104-T / ATCC 96160 / CBS 514.97 / LARS 414 / MAFF 240422) TaxID=1213857 RepID=N4VBC1_COLOR|nr:Methyltransferase [Colletotrichum orbiculare MAFF 240422]